VIGAGAAAYMLINELRVNPNAENRVVCIVDDNPHKAGKYMLGIPISGDRNQIPSLVEKYGIEEIIIAIPSAEPEVISNLVEICYQTNCRIRKLPIVANIVQGISPTVFKIYLLKIYSLEKPSTLSIQG
jgi:FlaA1/EpsC-like NDP-sugar epimerase